MKAQAKLEGPVEESLSHHRLAAKSQPAHSRSIATVFAARTEKKLDVDEGSGPSRVWQETAILELYRFVSSSIDLYSCGFKNVCFPSSIEPDEMPHCA